MEHSSYEVSEFYVMKTSGKMRVLLILMLPFSLSINILSYTFYALFRLFGAIARPKAFFREMVKLSSPLRGHSPEYLKSKRKA
jgi:hypothetical protein